MGTFWRSAIAVVLLVGAPAQAQALREKMARTGGLLMAYEVICALDHGTLGHAPVEKLRQRSARAGFDFADPSFMAEINAHAKDQIQAFKSDRSLCLDTKKAITKAMADDAR